MLYNLSPHHKNLQISNIPRINMFPLEIPHPPTQRFPEQLDHAVWIEGGVDTFESVVERELAVGCCFCVCDAGGVVED